MKARVIVERLMENPNLTTDFDAGRINVKKLMKEIKEAYELDGIDASPTVYLVINTLLERQYRFTQNPEIILDFGVGFAFEKLQFIPSSVWYALLILKGENRLRFVKLSMDSDSLLEELKPLYGEEINETVYVGTAWIDYALKVCTVYSEYHGKHIPAIRAVRVFNTDTGNLDWVYKEYSVEPVYSPKGFRLIEKQARWAYGKGYVPKSEIARSKWIGNWIWKYDDNYICVGNDYVPVEDVEKNFIYYNGKYYRKKSLHTFFEDYVHWSLHMFKPVGIEKIKGKIKSIKNQYNSLTLIERRLDV